MVETVIINIIGTIINFGMILFIYYEIKTLKTEINDFRQRLDELTEAVKYLTKLNIDKLRNGKSKVVSFRPEDLDKIKEMLNVS